MFKRGLPALAVLATAAALALTPSMAAAQRHGGGRAGPGYAGGGARYYGGGARYDGGARYYGAGPRYYYGRGYPYYRWGIGVGIGYPWSYGYYGYQPWYYGGGVSIYNASPDYIAPPSYYYGAPVYDYGYAPPAQDNSAHIQVIVPAGAKVLFGNGATLQDGTVRLFDSPPLTPGRDYVYDITAQWRADGKDMTATRHVVVRANATVIVDFTQPAAG